MNLKKLVRRNYQNFVLRWRWIRARSFDSVLEYDDKVGFGRCDIVYINLAHRTDRRAHIEAEFARISKGGLPVVGMLSVPILSFWINPLTAAALLLPIYLVSDVYGIWLYRKTFSARNLAILIPSGVFGVVIGYLTAPYLSLAALNGAVGAIGIFYCLRQWVFSKPSSAPREAHVPAGVFWGTLSGLTSFVSHAGAPPFQVYVLPQKLPKLAFAGTATITFAIINLAKLPPYLALHQFPDIDWLLIFCLIFVALFGAWSGAKLTRLLPETIFFTAIQIALFALSVQLIWRALTGIE